MAEDIPLLPAVPAPLLQVVASEVSEAGLLEAAVLPEAGEFARLFGLYFPAHQSCTPGTLLLRRKIYPRKSIANSSEILNFMTASDFVLGAVVLVHWSP